MISTKGKILIVCSICFLLIYVILSFFFSFSLRSINADAYYYIGVTKCILEGNVPYIDFHLGYTPLSFYIMCIPIYLFGSTQSTVILSIFIIHFINAFLLYKIIKNLAIRDRYIVFLISIYISLCYIFDGHVYCLEPYVSMWGLVSLLIALSKNKYKLPLSGFFCALSFLSKQYGLGYFVLLSIFYFIKASGTNKHKSRLYFSFCLSYILTIVLIMGIIVLPGIDSFSTLTLTGNNYEKTGFFSMIKSFGFLASAIPLLVYAIFTFIINKLWKEPLALVAFLGVFGFMLSTFVRPYFHYYQLALPSVIILSSFTFSYYRRNNIPFKYTIGLTILLLFAIITWKNVRTFPRYEKLEANNHAASFATMIPVGSRNVFVDAPFLNIAFLNDYYPPLPEKYGWSNGFIEEDQGLSEMLAKSDFCILTIERNEYIQSSMKDVYNSLNQNSFKFQMLDNSGQCYAVFYIKQ